jgi:DNA-binding PadR family transcriptional regulator
MTDAELAILSLLAEGPSYDHDMNTAIDERGIRKWTAIGHSSMYYVLGKLEQQGLVEQISEEFGHRRFQISAAGVGVLQTAVADLLSMPHTHDRSFELGLANLHVLKPSQVRSALLNRQQDLQAQLTAIREERSTGGNPFQIDALYAHNVVMIEAELAWLHSFAVEWEAQAPPEPEGDFVPGIAPRNRQVILPEDPDSIHKHSTQPARGRRSPLPQTRPLSRTQRLPPLDDDD